MTTKGAKVRKVILWVLAVVGVIAIIAVILGAGFLRSTMSSMAEDYDAYTVERGEMTVSIQGTGAMQSADVRDVISARGGKVQNLSVEAGQRVEAGDTLYEVYDESLENLITQEQNSIESNKISRSKLSAGYKNYKVYAPVDGVISALLRQEGRGGGRHRQSARLPLRHRRGGGGHACHGSGQGEQNLRLRGGDGFPGGPPFCNGLHRREQVH